MNISQFLNMISHKNKRSASSVAMRALKKTAIGTRMKIPSPLSCEYDAFKDYPATHKEYSCLSEQFASHMFNPKNMYDTNILARLISFFNKTEAGIISGFASNDESERERTGEKAVGLILNTKRLSKILISRLNSRDARIGMGKEILNHLRDQRNKQNYFSFDGLNQEIASISEKHKDRKHRGSGGRGDADGPAKKKTKILMRELGNFGFNRKDKKNILETYFIDYGKDLGRMFIALDKDAVNLDRDLARTTESGDAKEIMEERSVRKQVKGFSVYVGEDIRNNNRLGRIFKRTIIDAGTKAYDGIITADDLGEIHSEIFNYYTRNKTKHPWAEKAGEKILEKSIMAYLMDEVEGKDASDILSLGSSDENRDALSF